MTDNLTFRSLNSYFLNTATMKINEDYLNHLINVHCFNSDRQLFEDMHNGIKVIATCGAVVGMVNELFEYSDECPNTTTCTNTSEEVVEENMVADMTASRRQLKEVEQYRQEEIFAETEKVSRNATRDGSKKPLQMQRTKQKTIHRKGVQTMKAVTAHVIGNKENIYRPLHQYRIY